IADSGASAARIAATASRSSPRVIWWSSAIWTLQLRCSSGGVGARSSLRNSTFGLLLLANARQPPVDPRQREVDAEQERDGVAHDSIPHLNLVRPAARDDFACNGHAVIAGNLERRPPTARHEPAIARRALVNNLMALARSEKHSDGVTEATFRAGRISLISRGHAATSTAFAHSTSSESSTASLSTILYISSGSFSPASRMAVRLPAPTAQPSSR